MPLRVVADSNTLISAVLWRGVPSTLLGYAGDRYQLITTAELLAELGNALRRGKFAVRLESTSQTVESLVEAIGARSLVVSPALLEVPLRDPDDLKVIQAAIGGGADLIVTNDADLLSLGTVEGIGIVRPVDLLHTLGLHRES
ncbi:MAG TPA: putative toxin-antitoxin system toxin component, PIN family [Tepidiformaceae bacterium]|nr:putative toxin-antitoxin system toxin component, PIN family [Tepidiformaceae bacterium]